jgi:hypothetical protein
MNNTNNDQSNKDKRMHHHKTKNVAHIDKSQYHNNSENVQSNFQQINKSPQKSSKRKFITCVVSEKF